MPIQMLNLQSMKLGAGVNEEIMRRDVIAAKQRQIYQPKAIRPDCRSDWYAWQLRVELTKDVAFTLPFDSGPQFKTNDVTPNNLIGKQ